jgi:hypothetical protein
MGPSGMASGQAVLRAADCLSEAGFRVEPFSALHPGGLERARQAWWNIFVRAGRMAFLRGDVRTRE